MLTFRPVILSGILLGALSCSRSPQAYVEKGNRFAAERKYQDASIQYRKALQTNPQFGEAAYRLALSELEQHNAREAYNLLSRAVELAPDNQDAKVRLADLSLALYWADPRRPKAPYEKMVKIADELLAKNPNSFDGLRLKGAQAMMERQPKLALEYFGKANIVKPMQPGLVIEFVQALLADGQEQSAERMALELISRERTYGATYDILYRHYLRQKRAADAEALLKNKVDNKPEDSDSRLQLATHYVLVRKPDEMKTTLQRLVDDPKTFPKGRLQVADFYSRLGDWQHALEQFEAGARLNLNPADKLSYEKGVVNALMALGKREDASKRVDSLAREYPKDLDIKATQSSVWLLSGQPAQIKAAIVQLEDLTKQKPDDVRLRYELARAYRGIRNWDSARVKFQGILKHHRGSLEARFGLAEIGLAQNKPQETLTYADEILANGENRRARLFRSAALISMRNYPQARNELNRVLRTSPQDRDAQVQVGTLAILEKRYKDAASIFGKLRQDGKPDIRSSAGLVDAYVADNHYDRAIQVLNEDLKRSPDSAGLRRLLATTATRAGRYDIALEQYGKLLAIEPGSPELYIQIARVHQLKGDGPGAIAHLQKAKELWPKDPGPTVVLASFLQQAGRLDEARANYQQVLQLQPDNIFALNNLANLLADTGGNLDEALKLAQRAQQKQPGVLSFADTLGWVYLKKNMTDSALQVFSISVKKEPDNPTFRYHLGLALLQKGDKEKARSELQTALKKNPAKDEEAKIREAIARIG